MNKLKQYGADIAILVLFLVVAFSLYTPLIEGKQLNMGDIVQYHGMSKEMKDYQLSEGRTILWSNNMHSGMPTYMRGNNIYHDSNIGAKLINIFRTILPMPIASLFLSLICFWLLGLAFKINRWLSALGAIIFAFSTFGVVSYEAGHNTKMIAVSLVPLVLAGLVQIFRNKKYILGFILLALGASMQVGANHVQIVYYTLIFSAIYLIYETVLALKVEASEIKKKWIFSILGAVLALGVNFNFLLTNYIHSKQTIRGGSSVLETANSEGKKASSGLDYDYATGWSLEPSETLSLLIPNFKGGASAQDMSSYKELTNAGIPANALENMPTYWGDMVFTSGPMYIGMVAFFLFVLYLFVSKDKFRWYLLGTVSLSLFIAWGKYSFLYDFMFYNLPLFNKFRVPSMIILLTSMLVALGAILGVKSFLEAGEARKKALIYTTAVVGGLIIISGFLLSGTYSFSGASDARYKQMGWPIDVITQARKLALSGDTWRSLILIIASAGVLFVADMKRLSSQMVIGSLFVLISFDMFGVAERYISEDDFVEKSNIQKHYQPREIDKQIKKDKDPYYRVFDTTVNLFSEASVPYHHKSVGGYSAVKLRLYQDLIDHQLTKGNRNVIDMLNAKYFVVAAREGLTYQPNPNALGNAWVVSDLIEVDTPQEEMGSLVTFDPKSAAVVSKEVAEATQNITRGDIGQSSVKLTSYDPEKLSYDAQIEGGDRMVVFSEIYYNTGYDEWKLEVDGTEVPIHRVNYALRGAIIPEGNHKLEMRFEPSLFYTTKRISQIFSLLLLVVIGYAIAKSFKKEEQIS